MTDRPILFSAPMVRALLEGRKTQTRRVPGQNFLTGLSSEQAEHYEILGWETGECDDGFWAYRIAVGGRLWVKETWRPHYLGDGIWDLDVSYAADGAVRRIMDGEFGDKGDKDWSWPKAADRGNVSPLFMPRWASRLTLVVTDVRVQRLRDISEADALAEGMIEHPDRLFSEHSDPSEPSYGSAVTAFGVLWDSLNAKRGHGWDTNPWVCALTFEVHRYNIDQMELANREPEVTL